MDRDQAERILKPIFGKRGAGLDGDLDDGPTEWSYVLWDAHDSDAVLDGKFTPDQLEAIAWWMRNEVDPTRD